MNTALIGIDYIVDIMHPDGKISRSAPQAAERGVIDRFNNASEIAHRRGWPVVLVKVGFEPGYPDHPANSPVFGRVKEFGALDLGAPGTTFHPDLTVVPTDTVITKPRVSAFFGTRLQQLLSARSIDRLVLAGVSTSMAVQSTAREAHDRDYQVLIAEDACAAATAAEHDVSIELLRSVATITSSAALDELS